MGGAVALELAVNHPTHVAGLGLIATGAYLGVDPTFLEHLANPVTIPNALHIFQMRAFGSQATPILIERCMQAMKETRSSVLYGDWRACSDFDLREAAVRVEAPAWVICGSEDRLTPINYANFLAGSLPAARLQIIPGAGHMLILEQPGRVAQGLQQFLAALSAARFSAARVRLPMPITYPISTYQKKNQ